MSPVEKLKDIGKLAALWAVAPLLWLAMEIEEHGGWAITTIVLAAFLMGFLVVLCFAPHHHGAREEALIQRHDRLKELMRPVVAELFEVHPEFDS